VYAVKMRHARLLRQVDIACIERGFFMFMNNAFIEGAFQLNESQSPCSVLAVR